MTVLLQARGLRARLLEEREEADPVLQALAVARGGPEAGESGALPAAVLGAAPVAEPGARAGTRSPFQAAMLAAGAVPGGAPAPGRATSGSGLLDLGQNLLSGARTAQSGASTLGTLGQNFNLGGVEGVLVGLPATVASLGWTAAEIAAAGGTEAALEASAAAIDIVGMSTGTSGLVGAGGAVGAAPYAAAAILAALSVKHSVETSRNWDALPPDVQAGTRWGAQLAPGGILTAPFWLSGVIPERYASFVDPVGGFLGGTLVRLFGGKGEDRPSAAARSAGEAQAGASGLSQAITGAGSLEELAGVLNQSWSPFRQVRVAAEGSGGRFIQPPVFIDPGEGGGGPDERAFTLADLKDPDLQWKVASGPVGATNPDAGLTGMLRQRIQALRNRPTATTPPVSPALQVPSFQAALGMLWLRLVA